MSKIAGAMRILSVLLQFSLTPFVVAGILATGSERRATSLQNSQLNLHPQVNITAPGTATDRKLSVHDGNAYCHLNTDWWLESPGGEGIIYNKVDCEGAIAEMARDIGSDQYYTNFHWSYPGVDDVINRASPKRWQSESCVLVVFPRYLATTFC